MSRQPSHAPVYHRVAGVECHPAPEGWIAALGVLAVALALTIVPQCVWDWISKRERLSRALGLEDFEEE